MDTTSYIDQNASQACQPEFLKIWREWIFLFKNPRDFTLNRDILKSHKKNGIQVISRLFERVLSSIEIFFGVLQIYWLLNAGCYLVAICGKWYFCKKCFVKKCFTKDIILY